MEAPTNADTDDDGAGADEDGADDDADAIVPSNVFFTARKQRKSHLNITSHTLSDRLSKSVPSYPRIGNFRL